MGVGRSFRHNKRVYRFRYRGPASKKSTHRMLQQRYRGKWVDQWHDWEKRPFTYSISRNLRLGRFRGGGNFE